MPPHLVDLDEWLVEPLQSRLEDLAGVGPRHPLQVDLVLGDPVPGRFGDHVLLAVREQRLLHPGGDDQQVGGVVQ
jgi:hypothetical protein